MDSCCMNLAVVSGALQRQTTLYEWIWGIEVRPDIASWRFMAVLVDMCHGSAGTPLGTHAIGQDSGLEESRETIRT
jgi:hypothetical protein